MSDDPHSPGPPRRQRAGHEAWFEPAPSPPARPDVYPVSPPERAWPSVRPPHPPAHADRPPRVAARSPFDPYRSRAPQPRPPFDWRDSPLDGDPAYPAPPGPASPHAVQSHPAQPYAAQRHPAPPHPAQSYPAAPHGAVSPHPAQPGPVPAYPVAAARRDESAGWAWVLLAAAVVFLASAAWFAYQRTAHPPADLGAVPDRGASSAPSTPTWPSCAEVFVTGRTIDTEAALAPCRDPDGRLKAVGNFVCRDGRRLFQVGANTGAPAGWGFGGNAYRETADAATDRDYAAAYRECTS